MFVMTTEDYWNIYKLHLKEATKQDVEYVSTPFLINMESEKKPL